MRIKFSSVVLFIAGAGILIALPWFETFGLFLWFTAKIVFFLGVIAYLFKN